MGIRLWPKGEQGVEETKSEESEEEEKEEKETQLPAGWRGRDTGPAMLLLPHIMRTTLMATGTGATGDTLAVCGKVLLARATRTSVALCFIFTLFCCFQFSQRAFTLCVCVCKREKKMKCVSK